MIKVSSALRKGVVPPNMLFEKLNPKLLPFTSNLRVATEEQPWPRVADGQPRRASLNCFGFGGTNAHAIVESYGHPTPVSIPPKMEASLPLATPLVFSANSERSLALIVAQYKSFLETDQSMSLNDLAWTLQTRRSELAVKAVFSGPSKEELLSNMGAALAKASDSPPVPIGQRTAARTAKARILGVFTGQGAQWAGMGRDLILSSTMAKKTIDHLEGCMGKLPDGPSWSLIEELTDKDRASRLDEAELAQPICTAVQIVVIDILQSAGIDFSAVIGHSSGEIGAAYAAGVITASEAIKIAYYRGYHSKLSKGPGGQAGTMLAAGLSFEEAQEFCSQPSINGRVQVAASNAPASVTLSGDVDAIQEAKAMLDKQKTFNRPLKVNKAYHSRHMVPSSEPYINSLKACGISARYPKEGCRWFSSVYGDRIEEAASLESLGSTYWNDNMLRPVLFSMALDQAMQDELPFDLALEVGPHAALKGPALQTIKSATGSSLPYGATLTRGMNDVAAISSTFGFLMGLMPTSTISLGRYTGSFLSDKEPQLVTGLPVYAWDRSQSFWSESRYSRHYRLRDRSRHDLLGDRYPDDLQYDMRWRNTLRVAETPWLAGHKVQGQIVYPAAAYLVMAMEASKFLSPGQPAKIVELLDVNISRAIPLEDDASGVDTLFGLRKIQEGSTNGEHFVEAEFNCFSSVGEQAEDWELNANGRLRLILADSAIESLPQRDTTPTLLNPLNVSTFYESLKKIGFEYTGSFRRLDTIERRMNRATCTAIEHPEDKLMTAMVHPSLLDAAFQTLFAAFQYPEDGSMNAPYVPTNIKSIRINTSNQPSEDTRVIIESFITENKGSHIVGDTEVYNEQTGQLNMQIEGLSCISLDRPSATNDNEIYAQTVWKADVLSGTTAMRWEGTVELLDFCERLCYSYLRQISAAVAPQAVQSLTGKQQHLFEWISELFPVVESGQHPTIREEWSFDDPDWLAEQCSRFASSVDIRLISLVGQGLLSEVNGEHADLEKPEDFWDAYCDSGLDMIQAYSALSAAANQIAHRYPGMKIIDIGSGTSSATKSIIVELGQAFKTYTFTTKTTEGLSRAQEVLKKVSSRIKYQTLDIEGDVLAQGYEEHSFDMVVAANTLYAVPDVRHAMANIRKLLRPGGHLLLLEPTGDVLRANFIMSARSDWLSEGESLRHYDFTISTAQWAHSLKEAGFSGVDEVVNGRTADPMHMVSVMLSQAVNTEVSFLRDPLSPPALSISPSSLCIIGRNSRRRADIQSYLRQSCKLLDGSALRVTCFNRMEELLTETGTVNSVIFLQDLDEPIWKSLTEDKLRALRKIFDEARHVLWVTSGCRLENPFANMSVGLGRGLQAEFSHVRLQLIDVNPKDLPMSNPLIAAAALRLVSHDAIKASSPDLLWTVEPELVIEGGKVMIPRVITDTILNNRLNSIRRTITTNIDPSVAPLLVSQVEKSFVLSEPRPAIVSAAHALNIKIRVSHSVLSAIRITDKIRLHLCLGRVLENGQQHPVGTEVLAFSSSNGSIVDVSAAQVVPVTASTEPDRILQSTAIAFVANHVLSQAPPGSTILMFDPNKDLVSCFERVAQTLGLEVVALSSNPASEIPGSTYVNLNTAQRKLRTILPAKARMLLNFVHPRPTGMTALEACLPKSCVKIHLQDIVGIASSTEDDEVPANLRENMVKAQSFASSFSNVAIASTSTSLLEVGENPHIRPFPCVLDFTKDEQVAVNVAPIDTSKLFRSDRTYLLVGCTGGLGQSLCRHMVSNGAKHLALTSRNPEKVDKTWLNELRALGGEPVVFGVDITNAMAMKSIKADIINHMPAIAGVVNAAMVLSDRLFTDMTLEDFEKVLKPKVQGTTVLDKLFSSKDLDFFILFSSFSSIVGNRGQTNYLAANLFMATIAAQRRARGLAASVMHIGMVLGLGVVFQTGLYESTMKRLNLMPISEPAFLDMFAECIIVGRPDSESSNDIITGLGRLSHRANAQNPFYVSNVRFSHHFYIEEDDDSTTTDSASVPLKQQLAAAKGTEDRSGIIQTAFISKLERILQTPKEHFQAAQPLLALGVDSLMAVEIRSWFLSEIEVDMPVLKVLGGASIAELCTTASNGLPDSILSTPTPAITAVEDVKVSEVEKKVAEGQSLMTTIGASIPEAQATTNDSGDSQTRSTSNSGSVTPLSDYASLMAETPLETPENHSDEESYFMVPKVDKHVTFAATVTGASADLERVGRMSFSQERLWFLQSYLSDPTTYNITLAYKLTGPLRIKDLEQAFFATIERHEMLRTAFFTDTVTHQAQQGIHRSSPFRLERVEMINEDDVRQQFQKTKEHVYDLEHAESMKATLLSHGPDSHVLVMGYHHIALDATTSLLFVRDIAMIYGGMNLAPLKHQYLDYAIKQRTVVQHSAAKDIAYWKAEFPDVPSVLPFFDFGTTKVRKALTEYKVRILETRLDTALTSKIKAACQKLQVTPFHAHLATLQTLLHKFLQVKDICIGITDANKTDPDYADTLGFFVNLLPLRFQVDGKQSFTKLAQTSRDKTLQALEHSQLPFDVILNELKVPKSTEHNPLFQVLMNYKMGSNRTVPFSDCKAEVFEFKDASNPFDLQFDVESAVDGTTIITATTQEHLYSDTDLATILEVYCHLLKNLCAKPSLTISDHSMFSRQTVETALKIGKGPRIELDQTLTLTNLFDQAVEKRSNIVAVVDNLGGCLTWNQMAARVHALATHLLRVGVQAKAFVGVYCEPTVNSICYWLAILRIGAIYVPLDISNPAPRLKLIVEDCKPSAIICDKHTVELAQGFNSKNCKIITMKDLNGHRPHYVRDASQPASVACVIYTSGTTGTPKGTLLTNSNLVNHILGVNERFKMREEVVLQPTNLGFDLSLAQMIQFLASQGKLVVASYQTRTDPSELAKLMILHGVTYTITTPSVYSLLLSQASATLDQCTTWRSAISCGEALTGPVIEGFQALRLPNLRLINSCGPTEITIINSAWEIPLAHPKASEYRMMIGSSLPNYSTYVLDQDLNPLPVGFAGEMVCGGASISHGYLGKEELTTAKWVRDPFATSDDRTKGWNRMYRTGDKAKLLPDGQLVFLGRIGGDQQVKLRGVRIELDDIANTIIRHGSGDVSEAAVSLRGDGDSAFLVAFVVLALSASNDKTADWSSVFINGLPLPSSMKPSRLVVLKRLPRTPNGKIDMRSINTMALPSLSETSSEDTDWTTTEASLKNIWTNCLPSISTSFLRRSTDFFNVGGNSMLLVSVQAQIETTFGVKLPLFKLFQASIMTDMAALINAAASPEIKTAINWNQVTALEKSLLERPRAPAGFKAPAKSELNIVLTGATGFLGSCILRELVRDERVATVHCVAIRVSQTGESRALVIESPKIVKHYGDLAAPRLGLSVNVFEELSQNADRIIHNGADVSFLKAYNTLERTNFGSTKELARLAASRKTPFHFVSTAGVASFIDEDELPEVFISAHQPPVDGRTGYAASKWACEKYLEECSQELDIPVWIHRPSNIIGAGAENVNMTANLIDYSLRIGAAPHMPNLRGYMQFVEVEFVGQVLVDSLFSAQEGAKVMHHCSEEKVEMANLRSYLEKKHNRKLLSLALEEWVDEAKTQGLAQGTATMMVEVLKNAENGATFKTLAHRSKRLSVALTSWFQETEMVE